MGPDAIPRLLIAIRPIVVHRDHVRHERADDPRDVETLAYMSVLSVRQRAVIVLTYWHDLDQERIAATLGISRSSVAKHSPTCVGPGGRSVAMRAA